MDTDTEISFEVVLINRDILIDMSYVFNRQIYSLFEAEKSASFSLLILILVRQGDFVFHGKTGWSETELFNQVTSLGTISSGIL